MEHLPNPTYKRLHENSFQRSYGCVVGIVQIFSSQPSQRLYTPNAHTASTVGIYVALVPYRAVNFILFYIVAVHIPYVRNMLEFQTQSNTLAFIHLLSIAISFQPEQGIS